MVVVALLPCFAMATYNTGLPGEPRDPGRRDSRSSDWQNAALPVRWAGATTRPSSAALVRVARRALLPARLRGDDGCGGIGIEVIFCIVRKHEVNEGFFVTGALIPLICCRPRSRSGRSALGTLFGLVFSKEVFGGTGMNFLNPALVCTRHPLLRLPRRHQRRSALDRGRLRGRWTASPAPPGWPRRRPCPALLGARRGGERVPGRRARLHGRDLGARLSARRRAADR